MATTHLKSLFRVVEDFPKPGISFIDITSILENGTSRTLVKESLTKNINETFGGTWVDKIVGIESRGFLFLDSIAEEYEDVGIILARKPGKLPGEVVTKSYGTEYSKDSMEMQLGSIKEGDRVIIHDDILATGGTALAVTKLVEGMGGIVVGYSFLGEIDGLEGRSILNNVSVACPFKF